MEDLEDEDVFLARVIDQTTPTNGELVNMMLERTGLTAKEMLRAIEQLGSIMAKFAQAYRDSQKKP